MSYSVLFYHAILTFIPLLCLAFRSRVGFFIILVLGGGSVLSNQNMETIESLINFWVGLGYFITGAMGIFFWQDVDKLPPIPNTPIYSPMPPLLKNTAFSSIKIWGIMLSMTILASGILGTINYDGNSDNYLLIYKLDTIFWIIVNISSVLGFCLLALRNANGWLCHISCTIFIAIEIMRSEPPNTTDALLYSFIMLILIIVYSLPIWAGLSSWNKHYKKQQILFARYKS